LEYSFRVRSKVTSVGVFPAINEPGRILRSEAIAADQQGTARKDRQPGAGQEFDGMPVSLLHGRWCGLHVVATLRASLGVGAVGSY
jgi:hypothetical protein